MKKICRNRITFVWVLFLPLLIFRSPSANADVFENNPVLELNFIDIPITFDKVYSKVDKFNIKIDNKGLIEYTTQFHFIVPTQFSDSEAIYRDYVSKLSDDQYAGRFIREKIIGTPNLVFFLESKKYDIDSIEVSELDKPVPRVFFKRTAVCVSPIEPCNYFGRRTPRKWFSGEGYVVMWRLDLEKTYEVKIKVNTRQQFVENMVYRFPSLILLPFKHVEVNQLRVKLPESASNTNSTLEFVPYSRSSAFGKLESPLKTYTLDGVNDLGLPENFGRNTTDYEALRANIAFKVEADSWLRTLWKNRSITIPTVLIIIAVVIARVVFRLPLEKIVRGMIEGWLKKLGIPVGARKSSKKKSSKQG